MIATSIEQSKRLIAAGVPMDSADMYWRQNFDIKDGEPVWRNGHFISLNPQIYHISNPKNEFPAWSISALWQMVHELDKTYEFPTELSADELIEVLVKTIIFRKNQDARKGMD